MERIVPGHRESQLRHLERINEKAAREMKDQKAETTQAVSPEERQRQIRKLGHDIKSDLAVVTMGLQALGDLRRDEAKFDEVMRTIHNGGVDTLKQTVNRLVELCCQEDATSSESE